MPDYKKMYLTLFHGCSKAMAILEDVTLKMEEIVMSTNDPVELSTVGDEAPGQKEG